MPRCSRRWSSGTVPASLPSRGPPPHTSRVNSAWRLFPHKQMTPLMGHHKTTPPYTTWYRMSPTEAPGGVTFTTAPPDSLEGSPTISAPVSNVGSPLFSASPPIPRVWPITPYPDLPIYDPSGRLSPFPSRSTSPLPTRFAFFVVALPLVSDWRRRYAPSFVLPSLTAPAARDALSDLLGQPRLHYVVGPPPHAPCIKRLLAGCSSPFM